MNILALTSAYPQPDDDRPGVTPTVQYFCEKWAEEGHKVVVIHNKSSFPRIFYHLPRTIQEVLSSRVGFSFPSAESRKPLRRTENGVAIFRIPMKKIIPHGKYGKFSIRRQLALIENTLEDIDFVPDVIISHWVNPQIQLAIPLKEKYHAIASLVFHTDCTPNNIARYELKSEVKKLDAIGCRNQTEAINVQRTLGLTRTPFICYSGIPDHYAEEQIKNLQAGTINKADRKKIIYVGRLVQYKNVDTIICALAKAFPRKDFSFNIVGSGAEMQNLKDLSKTLGITNNVQFHGQLSRSDAFRLMQESGCFIMVSDNETFGMVYLEAMLAGCVTIASRRGGIDGVIEDGDNGFLSEQGDVNSLVERLQIIDNLSQEDFYSIRTKAIETAYKFSDTNVARRYLEDVMHWKD